MLTVCADGALEEPGGLDVVLGLELPQAAMVSATPAVTAPRRNTRVVLDLNISPPSALLAVLVLGRCIALPGCLRAARRGGERFGCSRGPSRGPGPASTTRRVSVRDRSGEEAGDGVDERFDEQVPVRPSSGGGPRCHGPLEVGEVADGGIDGDQETEVENRSGNIWHGQVQKVVQALALRGELLAHERLGLAGMAHHLAQEADVKRRSASLVEGDLGEGFHE